MLRNERSQELSPDRCRDPLLTPGASHGLRSLMPAVAVQMLRDQQQRFTKRRTQSEIVVLAAGELRHIREEFRNKVMSDRLEVAGDHAIVEQRRWWHDVPTEAQDPILRNRLK